jgi:Domain of unknown function (DUF3870)
VTAGLIAGALAAQPRRQTADVDARKSVIVSGYARVATTAALHAVQEYFTVTLRIDRDSGVVTEVDSTAVTGLVRSWLAELLLGVDFGGDIAPVLAEIETSYLGQGNGAIRQAIGDAWRRYGAYRSR